MNYNRQCVRVVFTNAAASCLDRHLATLVRKWRHLWTAVELVCARPAFGGSEKSKRKHIRWSGSCTTREPERARAARRIGNFL